jgi:hypothetical protein
VLDHQNLCYKPVLPQNFQRFLLRAQNGTGSSHGGAAGSTAGPSSGAAAADHRITVKHQLSDTSILSWLCDQLAEGLDKVCSNGIDDLSGGLCLEMERWASSIQESATQVCR